METATDAGGGPERGIGARAAEAVEDPDSGDGNMYSGDAREVEEADDPDSGGDCDARGDNTSTEEVADDKYGSAGGGRYAEEAVDDTGGGVDGEPGIDAHTTEAAADPDCDVRGGDSDGPDGPDDLNNRNSDEAVSCGSKTKYHSYLIVCCKLWRVIAQTRQPDVTWLRWQPTVQLQRLPSTVTRAQWLAVWWKVATQTLRQAAPRSRQPAVTRKQCQWASQM